jgi:hypothetical protein
LAEAFRGAFGYGSVLAYTVPRGYVLRLELLTFTVTTDATAGIHKARVLFTDTALAAVTARLRDLNEGGPTMTLNYTYGIGLAASACTAATGWDMTDALPDTVLAPQTTVTVTALDDSGATIAGDAITGVVLYGDLVAEPAAANGVDDPLPPLLPGLLPGEVGA